MIVVNYIVRCRLEFQFRNRGRNYVALWRPWFLRFQYQIISLSPYSQLKRVALKHGYHVLTFSSTKWRPTRSWYKLNAFCLLFSNVTSMEIEAKGEDRVDTCPYKHNANNLDGLCVYFILCWWYSSLSYLYQNINEAIFI